MQIEVFCLCKSVRFNDRREPSLIDIFDTKWAAGEPVLIEPFVVAASIRFYRTENGTHRFQFVVREAGKVRASSTEIVSISELPKESTTYFLQMNMKQNYSTFGTYEFSIESGGTKIAGTPLYVARGSI